MTSKRTLQIGVRVAMICCAVLSMPSCRQTQPAVTILNQRPNLLENLKSDTEARTVAAEFWRKRFQKCGDKYYDLFGPVDEANLIAGYAGYDVSVTPFHSVSKNQLLQFAYRGYEWLGSTSVATKFYPAESPEVRAGEVNLYKRNGRWFVGGADEKHVEGVPVDEFVDIQNLSPCEQMERRDRKQ